ncbi:MAG: hypothetical protein ABSA03_08875, partial [Streptosporangiaceae bacterium]
SSTSSPGAARPACSRDGAVITSVAVRSACSQPANPNAPADSAAQDASESPNRRSETGSACSVARW